MNILIINAGSSSIKFKLFEVTNKNNSKLIINGSISGLKNLKAILNAGPDSFEIKFNSTDNVYEQALNLINQLPLIKIYGIDYVINRVVHGGDKYSQITKLNSRTIEKLGLFNKLDPLHQPYNLKIAQLLMLNYPEAKHYATFDTAFHTTISRINQIYAIPWEYTQKGIKRYGFHGLSYQYINTVLQTKYPQYKKWVIAHLGSGSSICAIQDGQSIACSMGFSVAEGLPMATRCGNIDPQILLYLMDEYDLSTEHVSNIIYNQSGLYGLSNQISSDVKELLRSNKAQAKLAINFFCQKVAEEISTFLVKLNGADGIVFTGGIGENSSVIREKICNHLSWLKVKIKPKKNNVNQELFNDKLSTMQLLCLKTDEESAMLYQLLTIL